MNRLSYSKRIVSILTSLSIIICQTGVSFADSFKEYPTVIEGERFKGDQLIEGDLVYFGVTTLDLNEANGIYEVPIYREGDLSKEASVTIHSLDISALYKDDYVLLGGNKKEFKSEMTLMQRASLGVNDEQPEEIVYQFDEYGNMIGETGRIPVATPTNLETEMPDETETETTDEDDDRSYGDLIGETGRIPVATPTNLETEIPDETETEMPDETETETSDEEGDRLATAETPTNLLREEDQNDTVISAAASGANTGKSRLALLKEQETGMPTRETMSAELGSSLTETIFAQLMPEQLTKLSHSSEQKILFKAGEGVKYVRFRIIDDGSSEGSEAFSFVITDTENAEPYIASSLSVIITDDEEPVLSSLSFDDEAFAIENGRARIRVRRAGSEYSMAAANIRGEDVETGEKHVYGTIVFAPYETEKETELYIDGNTRLSLADYTAAEPGEVTEAYAVRTDESSISLLSLENEEGISTAAVSNSSEETSFTININSKDYSVK
ncbi:MAG: Calx-beta domain-containing protein, partial [Clostridiales bacterium]|nr:Calx-beta domain-containing protein [Clostridiales bacterium]